MRTREFRVWCLCRSWQEQTAIMRPWSMAVAYLHINALTWCRCNRDIKALSQG